MTDSTTRSLVQQIVVNYVNGGTMFTAYDVTLAARTQGAQLRHGDGRDIVHEMFLSGIMGAGYQRTVVDIGAAAKPFVYHPFGDDPKTYTSPSSSASAQGSGGGQKSNSPGLIGRVIGSILGGSRQPSSGAAAASQAGSRPAKPSARGPAKLDLDASEFLPITRDELVKGAKKLSLWGNPWFGRRDLIPPASDERTKLIDRGMVSGGVVAPEEVAEIHRIGAEMDHYRPSLLIARMESQKAGQAAVEEERKRRQEEKQKKKEEAAARREARAAEIAHRHANDIVFLGRGVSGQLSNHESSVELLQSRSLPVLATPADVASTLGVTISKLRWLAYHSDVVTRTHYVNFEVPKKSGGMRTLSAPHVTLAHCQRWIFDQILNKLDCESAAHGFVSGRSILTNAQEHVGREVVINMDLEEFFPSITFPRIRFVFKSLGYSPSVATILALLCTECPRRRVTYDGQPYLVATGPRGLPQGACTSPALSNQVARRLDRRIQGLANRIGFTYTRYADDLTCSGDQPLKSVIGYVMACVRHIAEDEGFSINQKKTRVLRRNTAQAVTGLIVNDKPSVSRKKIRTIRAILHNARKSGLASQNRDDVPNFRAWLNGYIAFLSMTRPELGQEMSRQLSALSD